MASTTGREGNQLFLKVRMKLILEIIERMPQKMSRQRTKRKIRVYKRILSKSLKLRKEEVEENPINIIIDYQRVTQNSESLVRRMWKVSVPPGPRV